MATKRWIGGAPAVAQVTTAGINVFDATTTYGIKIGTVTITTVGVTSEQVTSDNLVTALNASTHPYFSGITWARTGSGSSSLVQGTADTAGVPFTFTTSASSGTGSWDAVSTATANAGPNVWGTAANWAGGVAPVNTDEAIVPRHAVILWDLDQSSIALVGLIIELGASVGLHWPQFQTSASATSSAATEYRETYLKAACDAVDLGWRFGNDTVPVSATRVKVNNTKAGASIATVHETPTASPDLGYAAYRYLGANAGADVYVRAAAGGFAIGADVPGETATIGDVYVTDPTETARVTIGDGVTWTTYAQAGGTNRIDAAAGVTSIEVNGGRLTIDGDYTVTTLAVNGGTVTDNHIKTSGNANTTVNFNGGTISALGSDVARTWATVNHEGGTLEYDSAALAITTYNEPTGRKRLTAAAI